MSWKLTLIKKGTGLITLQKYVIVNMSRIGEEEMMTEAKTILRIAKLLRV